MTRNSRGHRGFALTVTLLFLSLLIVMVSALFLTVREKMFQSQGYHEQVAALYLAELGIADAMSQLEADPDWTAGFSDKEIPGVPGRYSLEFNTSGTGFNGDDSINNVAGDFPDSHRGAATVPRGHCLLVVRAEVGKMRRTVEGLVEVGGGLMNQVDQPLLIDGKANLDGYVTIEGIQSLSSPDPVPAGIHSNLNTAAPDLVVVNSPSPHITGKVSCSSPDPASINLGGYLPGDGTLTAAATKTLPNIPIASIIAAHMGGSPVPVPTAAVLPPNYLPPPPLLGVTTLTHRGGPEYSYSGNLAVVGDLVLDGATLYVNGDLTVDGSISGEGSVWVAGKTAFFGSAQISTAAPDKVALYSQEGVTVQGFDGSRVMANYSDAGIVASWATVRNALANYPNELAAVGGVRDLGDMSPALDADPDFSGAPLYPPYPSRIDLGSGKGSDMTATKGAAGNLATRSILHGAVQTGQQGQALLPGEAASSARDFLIRRFFSLYSHNFGLKDSSPEDTLALAEARAGRLGYGGVDAINDHYLIDRVGLIQGMLSGFDLNHPGQATFQGLVYTHGYFVAQNEVTIIGAIVASVDPGASASSTTVGAFTVDPGDVLLLDGCRLLYVEEFFKPRRSASPTDRGVKLVLWDAR